MPLDTGQVATTKARVDSYGSGGNFDYFNLPKEGSATVRILPGKPDPKDPKGEVNGVPWEECVVAYKVGPQKAMLILPRENPRDHAIYGWLNGLYAKNDEVAKKMADDAWPKTRYFLWVIDRADEAAGPKLFTCPPTCMRDIIALFSDPDYGDLSKPENGTDITITVTKQSNGFPGYSVVPRRNATPCTANVELMTKIKSVNLFEANGVAKVSDAEYVQKVLNGTLERKGDTQAASGAAAPHSAGTPPAAPSSPAPPATGPFSAPTGVPSTSMALLAAGYWYLGAGNAATECDGKFVQESLDKGTELTICSKSNSAAGWKKAPEIGFIKYVAPPPTPAPAPPPTPAPAPPPAAAPAPPPAAPAPPPPAAPAPPPPAPAPAPTTPAAVMGAAYWVLNATNQPIDATGQSVQADLDGGNDRLVCNKANQAAGWVKASAAGFLKSPSGGAPAAPSAPPPPASPAPPPAPSASGVNVDEQKARLEAELAKLTGGGSSQVVTDLKNSLGK